MPKTLLVCFILCVPLLLAAQARIEVVPNPQHKVGLSADADVWAEATVTNSSSEEIRLIWKRQVMDAPAGWLSWVCDANNCYEPQTDEISEERANVLLPGESMALQVHVRPNQRSGVGRITVDLIDATNGDVLETFEQTFETYLPRPETVTQPQDIKVYPNPTTSYFRIYQDEQVDHIIIYTIIGKPIMNVEASQGSSYDVSSLPEGMYLVRLFADDQSVLKTIRLSRR